MPLYMLYGFRWDRQDIRVYVIENRLDDVAPEQLMTPKGELAMISSLQTNFAFVKKDIPQIEIIEEFNCNDLSAISKPYAYVAATVLSHDGSVEIPDTFGGYFSMSAYDGIKKLKEQLAPNAEVKWFVVENTDPMRTCPMCSGEVPPTSPAPSASSTPSAPPASRGQTEAGVRERHSAPATAADATAARVADVHRRKGKWSKMVSPFLVKSPQAKSALATPEPAKSEPPIPELARRAPTNPQLAKAPAAKAPEAKGEATNAATISSGQFTIPIVKGKPAGAKSVKFHPGKGK